MQIPQHLIPMIGPVVASVIAGAIAFLASVFTKEGKVSEFRQAWIDALRNDMADLIGVLKYLSAALEASASAGKTGLDWLDSQKQELLRAETLATRIVLRLNPSEHKALMDALRPIIESEKLDLDMNSRNVRPLLAETQVTLKQEWSRVKRGETIFRTTKWISLAVLVFSMLVLAHLLLNRIAV